MVRRLALALALILAAGTVSYGASMLFFFVGSSGGPPPTNCGTGVINLSTGCTLAVLP